MATLTGSSFTNAVHLFLCVYNQIRTEIFLKHGKLLVVSFASRIHVHLHLNVCTFNKEYQKQTQPAADGSNKREYSNKSLQLINE